ncbi:hypothetical protein VDGL01_03151 [Verticillium dahliae]
MKHAGPVKQPRRRQEALVTWTWPLIPHTYLLLQPNHANAISAGRIETQPLVSEFGSFETGCTPSLRHTLEDCNWIRSTGLLQLKRGRSLISDVVT